MGFMVHFCPKENTSCVIFIVEKTPCTCAHHEWQDDERIPECCCKPQTEDEPDDLCCDTLLFVLDAAQSVVDYLKVEVPMEVLAIAPQITYNSLRIFHETAVTAFHATNIVSGPDGGLASITPLRL